MCHQCVSSWNGGAFVDVGRIQHLNKACGDAYKAHYECLDAHNQQFKDCRPAERGLNACVMQKLVSLRIHDAMLMLDQGLAKFVPGTPEGKTPLWLEPDPIYGPKDQAQDPRGQEMELKYTGRILTRGDKSAMEAIKKKRWTENKEEDPVKS